MSRKKTPETKSLKQLAEALPPAYELHQSGGEVIKGGVPQDLRDKELKVIQADPRIPKGCIVLKGKADLYKPHVYKHAINHYRRLINAYNTLGMIGVTKYLDGIKKAQAERAQQIQKSIEIKNK